MPFTAYSEVGQLKDKNLKQLVEKYIATKTLSKLDLEPKAKVIAKLKHNDFVKKTCPPPPPPGKNDRGSLSNWCDTNMDTAANSSKTICLPPPCGGLYNTHMLHTRSIKSKANQSPIAFF